MTKHAHIGVSAAVAAIVAFAGSVALAAPAASTCHAWNPTKASRSFTHCIAWTHEAAQRMRAANCAPGPTGDAAMRALCLAMMGERQEAPAASGVAG